jgi:hypothetical protein
MAMFLVSLVLVAGCGSAAPTGGPSHSAGDTAGPSATLTGPSPTATPQATTPAELQGSWETTISTGERVTLELGRYGSVVHRGDNPGVAGDVDFDGERVVFSSPHCERGSGLYRWSVNSGELTFEPLEPRDPCPGRIIFLEGVVYTK